MIGKVDHRRIEDAFFQYAALRVASWYPEHFKLCALQLHAMTTMTIGNMISVPWVLHEKVFRCILVNMYNMCSGQEKCILCNLGQNK